LYFATIDTQLVQHNVRRATAVGAHFVNEMMSRSRSRRQILLLDCCYSGAFKDGMLAKGDRRVGAGDQFQGQGRVVLTASDALHYSFEVGQLHGKAVRSVFTQMLVRGLQTGEADLDRDGSYSLDEVYDYVHSRVLYEHPDQKPMKMGFVEGKIFIGNNPHPLPAELPLDIQESLDDPRRFVREGAVRELEKLLTGKNKGLVLAARLVLTSVAAQDDSLFVRTMANNCLEAQTQSQAIGFEISAKDQVAETIVQTKVDEGPSQQNGRTATPVDVDNCETEDPGETAGKTAHQVWAEAQIHETDVREPLAREQFEGRWPKFLLAADRSSNHGPWDQDNIAIVLGLMLVTTFLVAFIIWLLSAN
jgi:hypothetical protein